MTLYTFESSNSLARIANKVVVADTSYCISLKLSDSHTSTVQQFHRSAVRAPVDFCINSIVRLEFLDKIRCGNLIQAFRSHITMNPTMEGTYRNLPRMTNKTAPLDQFIASNADKLFKHHVREGDFAGLWAATTFDIGAEEQRLETLAGIQYLGPHDIYNSPREEAASWAEISRSLKQMGMGSRDSGIIEFALSLGADAIVTTDADYAPAANDVDIYMPRRLAQTCKTAYDPRID